MFLCFLCIRKSPRSLPRKCWTQMKGKTTTFMLETSLACSKRSDSGERCRVKKAMTSRGGLGREVSSSLAFFFAFLFTSHRSPLSERLEQAKTSQDLCWGGGGGGGSKVMRLSPLQRSLKKRGLRCEDQKLPWGLFFCLSPTPW